jgi:putative endonuclease
MFYVYILYSKEFDKYYIGQTDDIVKRLKRHNCGMVMSTKAYLPWEFKYIEEFASRSEAMKREKFLKKQKSKEFYNKRINSSTTKYGDTILISFLFY